MAGVRAVRELRLADTIADEFLTEPLDVKAPSAAPALCTIVCKALVFLEPRHCAAVASSCRAGRAATGTSTVSVQTCAHGSAGVS